jgi:predicted nucleic acid-binding protein
MPIISAFSEASLVVDNDVLTHWRNGRRAILDHIEAYITQLKKPPALASTTVFEALFGIEKSFAQNNISEEIASEYKNRLTNLTGASIVLPFDGEAASIAAHVFARLSQRDRNAHWRDLFIAATALSHRHGVATQNRTHFELIAAHLPDKYSVLPLAIWRP